MSEKTNDASADTPPIGEGRPGPGRPRGLPNRASIARQEQIARSGATPLDAMIQKMRWHMNKAARELKRIEEAAQAQQPYDTKVLEAALDKANEAAKDAAPFVHPKLASITMDAHHSGSVDLSLLSDEELNVFYRIRAKLASADALAASGAPETEH